MGITTVKETVTLTGSTGRVYQPNSWTFRKRVGELPTFEFVLEEDDLERIAVEDWFKYSRGGVTRFKGLVMDPVHVSLTDGGTLTVLLQDYLYTLARDYDLVTNTSDQCAYRHEYVDVALNAGSFTGIVYDLLDCNLGEPYWGYIFEIAYVPPINQTIRFEFENRTNALIRLAQACKYGRDYAGVLYTDPDHIITEDGVCDLTLDYDADGDMADYPGQVQIGILGARRIGSTDSWEWISNDITADIFEESLSQLQYRPAPIRSFFVIGAGDGLNQVVGKATVPMASDFSDIVRFEDKLSGGLYYTIQWDRPTPGTATAWTREDAGGGDYYLKAFEGTEADHIGCLRINKEYTYNSPTTRLQFLCETDKTGIGIYVDGVSSDQYWYLLVTFSSATEGHYQWIQRASGADTVICEGDIALTTGAWHDLELYCDIWGRQVYCAIDNEEVFWLNGQGVFAFHSGVGDRQVGLVAYFTNAGSSAADFVRFRKISVHDNRNVARVQVETDAKYLNCLEAYRRAEKLVAHARAYRTFSIDVEPSVFHDGKIDVGQRAVITSPKLIAGTYRILEIATTEEQCTLSLEEVAD